MSVNTDNYNRITAELGRRNTLVAVSKNKAPSDILELYGMGQRDFGENYVQELIEKKRELPDDIRWHFIGHLQSNKARDLVSFISLIQGVDSLKLLNEINKQASKMNRIVDCLLQVHIATEETKFGFDASELTHTLNNPQLIELQSIRICGLMGMASFTADKEKVRAEFRELKLLFDACSSHSAINIQMTILSMGMSQDYSIAMEEGSTMVRIGSLIFGARDLHH
jgi:PLP dependent protein